MMIEDFNLPLVNGARLRSWNFIKALSGPYDVYLFNIHAEDRGSEYLELAHHPAFKKVWSVTRLHIREDRYRSLSKRVMNLLRGIPWELKDLDHQPEIDALLERLLLEYHFDFVFARYILQARYLSRHRGRIPGVVIVDLDDIETRKAQRWMEKEGYRGLYDRLRKRLNLAIYERFHKNFLKYFDCCIVCSREDRDYLAAKKWARRIEVVPNTIDVDGRQAGDTPPSKVILFIGTLSYTPNAEGIAWFAREIFPRIRREDPGVRLLIVGSRPYPCVRDLEGPGITLHSNVSDAEIKSFYQQAGVVIVPIRIAAGTRIKILEASFYRRPVVSTTLGAEGLELVHDRHCLIADDEESFARSCLRVLNDGETARRLAQAGYDFVREHYGIQTVQRKILEIFQ